MKKILVFYSKTGGGHLRAAETIAAEIYQQSSQITVKLIDGLIETNVGVKTNPSFNFMILSGPLLVVYNLIYVLTDNYVGLKFLRFWIASVWGVRIKQIINEEKPDLIISTHHFISPSTIVGWDFQCPFMVVITDLGIPHRIWFDQLATATIIPTSEMEKYAVNIVGQDKVKLLGYPLQKKYLDAKHHHKFSNRILAVGSGFKSGLFIDWVKEISRSMPEIELTVICGSNEILKDALEHQGLRGVKILGFVENFDEMIEPADIIITKPGPGTVLEAASLGRPMIIGPWIGLQEKDNVLFVLKNKQGLYCTKTFELAKTIKKIYTNYNDYIHPMEGKYVGTERIVKYGLKLID